MKKKNLASIKFIVNENLAFHGSNLLVTASLCCCLCTPRHLRFTKNVPISRHIKNKPSKVEDWVWSFADGGGGGREGHTETETQRETEKDMKRERDRQTERDRERQSEKKVPVLGKR